MGCARPAGESSTVFHVKHGDLSLVDIERWLGIELSAEQEEALVRYQHWLAEEALPAGGIGPGERHRLFDRHIADSLGFLRGIPASAHTVIDVGGGVGLPSIPLAIVRPDLACTLVDRSRRRTELAARAGRILGLANFAVRMSDVAAIETAYDVAVFRASLPIVEAAASLQRVLRPGGVGLLAVSRREGEPNVPKAPPGTTFVLSREGDGVLESPFWLLRMRQR